MSETRSASAERGDVRPAEEFVGRSAELAFLREMGRLLVDGWPTALLVTGIPGVGTSELLRQAFVRCRDEDRKLSTVLLSPSPAAPADLFLSLARDLLQAGVRASEKGLSRGSRADREWARTVRGQTGELVRELADRGAAPDDPAGWHLLEGLAEEAALEQDARLLVLLDHAHLLPGISHLWTRLAARTTASGGRVSWVAAAPGPLLPVAVKPGFSLRRLDLGPLTAGEGEDLLAVSMRRVGVSFPREALATAGLLGGIPLLIWQAAAAARLRGIRSFEEPDSFLRFYAAELQAGFLHDHLRNWVGGGGGERESDLLAVLLHLLERGAPVHRSILVRELLMEESAVARVVDHLAARGLVAEAWGGIVNAMPPPLADFCRDQSLRHLEGCSPEECRARLFLEKRAALDLAAAVKGPRRNLDELRAFLTSWRGQALPRSLFDHERFRELFPAGSADREKLAAADRSRLTLPTVADAWMEDFPGSLGMPAYRLDLLALAYPAKDGAQRWVAVDVRLGEAEVTSDTVRDFAARLALFQSRTGAKAGQVNAWLISGGGFSSEAQEAARKLRCWTSGPDQLRLIAELIDHPRAMQLLLPPPAAEDVYSLQLVIPARAEIELVAARALEQLGEGLPLDDGEMGKVKMALVEACLNAFEHGKSEDRSVTLTFRVRPQCLEVEVFNRGSSFTPAHIVKPTVEEKFGASYKRGWGLSLIRELMDDMEFAQRDDGTLLKMTKYFQPRAGGKA